MLCWATLVEGSGDGTEKGRMTHLLNDRIRTFKIIVIVVIRTEETFLALAEGNISASVFKFDSWYWL